MNIQNPKFNFTEVQTLKILEASNYINRAADCLTEINGMLTSILNAFALDLIDQVGLTDELLSKVEAKPNLKITEAEKAEIDSLIETLNASKEQL